MEFSGECGDGWRDAGYGIFIELSDYAPEWGCKTWVGKKGGGRGEAPGGLLYVNAVIG